MKRKLLCIILAASLILSVVMPGTALAAKGNAPAHPDTITEFGSTMTVTWVEDTLLYQNVLPLDSNYGVIPYEPEWIEFYGVPFDAAQLAWWQVVNRQMTGEVSGDLAGTFAVTYSGILDLMQHGMILGTLEIDTKPGTSRGVIYGTFEGFTAVTDAWLPEQGDSPWFVDVMFLGAIELSGGTGIYRHIEGDGNFGLDDPPIRLFLDEEGHVIGVEGSMTMTGTYTRGPKR